VFSAELFISDLFRNVFVEEVTLQNGVGTSFHHSDENARNNV